METETSQQNNIKNQILDKIKSGEVNMKPKFYFKLRLIALIVTIFLTFILSITLVSYVLFSISIGGGMSLLGFGAKGIYHFFMALPWFILLLDVLLIVFLDWLLKSFRFGYNSSVLFLFVVTLVSITALASIINSTSFHKNLMYKAENNNLPVAGSFYIGLRKSHGNQGMFRGEIVSIEGTSTIYIKHNDFDIDDNDKIIRIIVPINTDITSFPLNIGDNIFIAGDVIDDEIRAYGLHKLTQDE